MPDFPPPSSGPSGAPETPRTMEIHQSSPDALWKPRVNPWIVAACVALAAFMENLDTSIANVALPHIAGSLAQPDNVFVTPSFICPVLWFSSCNCGNGAQLGSTLVRSPIDAARRL